MSRRRLRTVDTANVTVLNRINRNNIQESSFAPMPRRRMSTSEPTKVSSVNGIERNDSSKEESGLVFLKESGRGSLRQVSNIKIGHGHSPTHFLKGGLPCDPAAPPFQLSSYGEDALYTLVLLRHGESKWNKENRYTGWCDVDLTAKGKEEARVAGRLLTENGIEIDHCFTSVLKRAGASANLALTASNQHWVPLTKTWRLNERHYGALQSYNKDTAYAELDIDQELVMQMRRSYDTPPPVMDDDHPYWHGNDRRYKNLTPEQLERTRAESLHDTANRIMPFFRKVIIPAITQGNKVLVVSHANTLRTLIKHIDNISDEDIKSMSIPTGVPLLYRLDKNLKPVDPDLELEFRHLVQPKGYTWATSHNQGFHGVYLGDMKRLQEIQEKRDITSRNWQRIILHNIATQCQISNPSNTYLSDICDSAVMEVRQLWWRIHNKINSNPEFSNMILLQRAKDYLEDFMHNGNSGQRYITLQSYKWIVNQIHLEMEGKVIEPFVELNERRSQEERAKKWYSMHALDLEEEALIK